MIAALYVQTNGCYYGLDDVDPWDEARDARKYEGPWPVVAHPPCARWCRLAELVYRRHGHKPGDDGGTFKAALGAVRKWGGVLEHPAYSYAWAAHGLQVPRRGSWQLDPFTGLWMTEVDQAAYGHRANKATWLALNGEPHSLDWSRHDRGNVAQYMCSAERARTPPEFRDLLLDVARSCETIQGRIAPLRRVHET